MQKSSLMMVALLMAAPISSLLAQGESEDVRLRNRCRQFAQYLVMGPKHPHYEEALSGIGKCDETGGAVLGAVWRSMTDADSAAVGRLEYKSSRFRDRTLLDSLLTQIADESRPRPVRMEMLSVLVSYYAPARLAPSGAKEEGIEPEYCTLGGVTHFEATDGATPVTPADRPRILQVLQSLAAGDPDSFIRSAMACTVSAIGAMTG